MKMILLLDIGNTHTHLGLANHHRVVRQMNIPTASWFKGDAVRLVSRFVGRVELRGAALCSVVPRATPHVRKLLKLRWRINCLELTPKTLRGVGIDYPQPGNHPGPDRLANAKRRGDPSFWRAGAWWWISARR